MKHLNFPYHGTETHQVLGTVQAQTKKPLPFLVETSITSAFFNYTHSSSTESRTTASSYFVNAVKRLTSMRIPHIYTGDSGNEAMAIHLYHFLVWEDDEF